MVILLTDIN